MPTEIRVRRQGSNWLEAADPTSLKELQELPYKQALVAKITQDRNVGHHRKLFALLRAIHPHQDAYPTISDLLDAMKVGIGHYETFAVAGREYIKPKSISFAKMDQDDFEQLYERFVLLITEKILPSVNKEDLEQRVNEIMQGADHE